MSDLRASLTDAADLIARVVAAGRLAARTPRGDGRIEVRLAADDEMWRLIGKQLNEGQFRSNLERGRPWFESQPYVLHSGVSMFSNREAALERARRHPVYVARVFLPRGSRVCLARTMPEVPDHYTVWGSARLLFDNAQQVS